MPKQSVIWVSDFRLSLFVKRADKSRIGEDSSDSSSAASVTVVQRLRLLPGSTISTNAKSHI